MQVDAFLADSVVAAEGKLYVQGGGWNAIMAPAFPYRHGRLGIAVLVHVPWTATNQMHSFSLKIQDQDANVIPLGDAPPGVETPDGKVHELKGAFNVGRPPILTVGDEQVIPIAVNIDGLEFRVPNLYSLIVEIDNTEIRSLPFRIQPAIPVALPGIAS